MECFSVGSDENRTESSMNASQQGKEAKRQTCKATDKIPLNQIKYLDFENSF